MNGLGTMAAQRGYAAIQSRLGRSEAEASRGLKPTLLCEDAA